jgi:hypothetical protein
MKMNWNLFLLIVSVLMLLVFAGTGLVEHMMQAEAIAEDLAPRINVDKDVIRHHLEVILGSGSMRRTILYCSPLAFLSLLLTIRLIADRRSHGKADGG